MAENGAIIEDTTKRHTRIWIPVILSIAVLLPFALTHATAILGSLDEWSRDVRLAIVPPVTGQDENIVIVAVTEDTLNEFRCRLPVDRGFLADVIEALDEAGARAIGIDFILDSLTDPEKDEALQTALREASVPVLPVWADESIGTSGVRAETLRSFIGDQPTGYGMLRRDRLDGTVRFHYPVWNEDGPVRWQFAAAMAAALDIPIPEGRRHRIAWRSRLREGAHAQAFAQYEAHFVPVLPKAWFKDKIVLIGPVLVDVDLHRTPLTIIPGQDEMPGVEIHAHILSQILDGRAVTEPNLWQEALLALALATIGMALSLSRIDLWQKLTLSVLLLAAFIVSAFLGFEMTSVMMPVVTPSLAFITASAVASASVGRRERLQRAQIRKAFARYVPPTVVARLDRDPTRLKLGGERRIVSIMFTDIEGFTSSAEDVPPDVVGPLINDYFDGIGSIILAHGGTIDKFLGDGSMSLFGAPEAYGDDPDRALRCALALFDFGETFRARWAEEGFFFGRTRVGLDTGPAFVGNFGGRERFDYTAIGDVVNTAARLEGANKVLGTRILVSKASAEAAPSVTCRPAATVVLTGKQQDLEVLEPVSEADAGSSYNRAFATAYALLVAEDPAAREAFARLVAERPEDRLAAFHLTRLDGAAVGPRIVLTAK
ncbi:MAG: CHASE2 domain-containing protein [Alphaproteobacteria bacterium]